MSDERLIALTFDDGPGDSTSPILDCLERHGATATFFVLGRQVAGREHVLRRMTELGCEIGNHTFDHPRLSQISSARAEEELTRAGEAIASATGTPAPPLMRPPYGDWSSETLEVATKLGLTIVLWSLRTRDWDARPAAEIAEAMLDEARPGAVVVLHDASEAGIDRSETARAVEAAVPRLQEQGYRLVTVSELLRMTPGVARQVVARRRGPFRRAARAVKSLL